MARHRERAEGAEEAPVPERQQAEGDKHEQDRLLVHVPAEEERRVAAERHGAEEGVPVWLEPELGEAELLRGAGG